MDQMSGECHSTGQMARLEWGSTKTPGRVEAGASGASPEGTGVPRESPPLSPLPSPPLSTPLFPPLLPPFLAVAKADTAAGGSVAGTLAAARQEATDAIIAAIARLETDYVRLGVGALSQDSAAALVQEALRAHACRGHDDLHGGRSALTSQLPTVVHAAPTAAETET